MKIKKIYIKATSPNWQNTEVTDENGNHIACKEIKIIIDKNGIWAILKVKPETIEVETDKLILEEE